MATLYPSIEQLLPHSPPMVLLDSIIEHSASHIICEAPAPDAPDHPLRINGELSVFSGVEYAAQAMAAHAHLCAPFHETPKAGFLVTASKLEAGAERLDAHSERLTIRVNIETQSHSSSRCHFTIEAQHNFLLSGQLTATTQPLP